MPELPEVETVLRGLSRRALGRKIVSVVVHTPSVIAGPVEQFMHDVEGRRFTSLRRKGKALAAELRAANGAPPTHIIIRLGMTGQVTIVPQNSPLQAHTHVRFLFDDGGEEMRFRDPRRFGGIRSCSPEELERIFGRMGPDAREISFEQFEAARRGRTGAIKGWLLNQQMLAGLGNIYADEALFEAHVHPRVVAGRISTARSRELLRAIHKVLNRAVKLQGTSFRDYIDIEGAPGNYGVRLRVYQRQGERCRRCGITLRRIIVCGRSSHFCPKCQPRPRRTAAPGRPRKTKDENRSSEKRRKRAASIFHLGARAGGVFP
ncbi:MAG: bifunctional DNA-formamidopyrimidine glycosylase/DNA-(apurinic or apyrimidinic site) lyase [Terriglobia bacterium]